MIKPVGEIAQKALFDVQNVLVGFEHGISFDRDYGRHQEFYCVLQERVIKKLGLIWLWGLRSLLFLCSECLKVRQNGFDEILIKEDLLEMGLGREGYSSVTLTLFLEILPQNKAKFAD